MMGRPQKKQGSVYRRFVEAGIADIDTAFLETKNRSSYCIGSDPYIEEVAAQHEQLAGGYDHEEDLSFQRSAPRSSVETVQEAVADVFGIEREALLKRQHNSWLRPLCSRALQVYCGLTQREIGQVLSIGTGAAVSKQIRLLDEALSHDKELQSSWRKIERKLKRAK